MTEAFVRESRKHVGLSVVSFFHRLRHWQVEDLEELTCRTWLVSIFACNGKNLVSSVYKKSCRLNLFLLGVVVGYSNYFRETVKLALFRY